MEITYIHITIDRTIDWSEDTDIGEGDGIIIFGGVEIIDGISVFWILDICSTLLIGLTDNYLILEIDVSDICSTVEEVGVVDICST